MSLSDSVEVLLDGTHCTTCDTIMYAALALIVLFGLFCWLAARYKIFDNVL
jgi:hypothetical protein